MLLGISANLTDQYNFEEFFDEKTSASKKRRINEAIRDYLEGMKREAPEAWYFAKPPFLTGTLIEEGLHVGNVTRDEMGRFTLDMGMEKIQPGPTVKAVPGKYDEGYYPLWVQQGTIGKIIKAKNRGNVLNLRNKLTGNIFAQREEVKGQKANPYFTRFQKLMNARFGGMQKHQLQARILKILAE